MAGGGSPFGGGVAALWRGNAAVRRRVSAEDPPRQKQQHRSRSITKLAARVVCGRQNVIGSVSAGDRDVLG